MTDEIIHLLTERNRFLSQFTAINSVQIVRLKNKNFDQLNEFYMTREHILMAVEKIEILVNQKLENKSIKFTSENKKVIQDLIEKKDELIRGILGQDLDILSSIDKEKTSIISELKVLGKNKKTIGAYKSGSTTGKVDEEV